MGMFDTVILKNFQCTTCGFFKDKIQEQTKVLCEPSMIEIYPGAKVFSNDGIYVDKIECPECKNNNMYYIVIVNSFVFGIFQDNLEATSIFNLANRFYFFNILNELNNRKENYKNKYFKLKRVINEVKSVWEHGSCFLSKLKKEDITVDLILKKLSEEKDINNEIDFIL